MSTNIINGTFIQSPMVESPTKPNSYLGKRIRKITPPLKLHHRQLHLSTKDLLKLSLEKLFKTNPNPDVDQISAAIDPILVPSEYEQASNSQLICKLCVHRINDAWDIFQKLKSDLKLENPQIDLEFAKSIHESYITLVESEQDPLSNEELAELTLKVIKKTKFMIDPRIYKAIFGNNGSFNVKSFLIPVTIHDQAIRPDSSEHNDLKRFFKNYDIDISNIEIPPLIETDTASEVAGHCATNYIISYPLDSSKKLYRETIETLRDSSLKTQLLYEINNYSSSVLSHELTHYFLKVKVPNIRSTEPTDLNAKIYISPENYINCVIPSNEMAREMIAYTMSLFTDPIFSIATMLESKDSCLELSKPIIIICKGLALGSLAKDQAEFDADLQLLRNMTGINYMIYMFHRLGQEKFDQFVKTVQEVFKSISGQLLAQTQAQK